MFQGSTPRQMTRLVAWIPKPACHSRMRTKLLAPLTTSVIARYRYQRFAERVTPWTRVHPIMRGISRALLQFFAVLLMPFLVNGCGSVSASPADVNVAIGKCKSAAGNIEETASCICTTAFALMPKDRLPQCLLDWQTRLKAECYSGNDFVARLQCKCEQMVPLTDEHRTEHLAVCIAQQRQAFVALKSSTCAPQIALDCEGAIECRPAGSTCCAGHLCATPNQCLPIGENPNTEARACFGPDQQYCSGIGVCRKGFECWQFDGQPACVPPEPQDCGNKDCGLYGPHYCEKCCPAYRQHLVTWCDSALGWGKAHCECENGRATTPSDATPKGPRMTIEFTNGTSPGVPRIATTILITFRGRSATGDVGPGSTPAGCAAVLQRLSVQAGIQARLEGLGGIVTVWGAGVKVTVTGECPIKCSAPNCSL